MAEQMAVSAIMTSKICSLSKGQTIREAAKLMTELNIGAAPVLEGDKIVGMFSERDILKRVVAKDLDVNTCEIDDVMSSPVITITEDEKLHAALYIMTDQRIRHLPIVDKDGKMVGIVGIRGLLQALLGETIDAFVTGK